LEVDSVTRVKKRNAEQRAERKAKKRAARKKIQWSAFLAERTMIICFVVVAATTAAFWFRARQLGL